MQPEADVWDVVKGVEIGQSHSFPRKNPVLDTHPFKIRFSLIHFGRFFNRKPPQNFTREGEFEQEGGEGEEKERERECVFLPARAR